MVRSLVVQGLERNASREAIGVLASLLNNPDVEVARMSRSALSSIGQKSKDPEVKELVRRALSK